MDIETEHGEFRPAMSVREADRVGESRPDLVFGNHHDVPSVLLHMLDDRLIHAGRFVPVAVVMAEDAAAVERISSHVRRVRGEHSRRATGVWTPHSNGSVTLRDGSPRSVPKPETRRQTLLLNVNETSRLNL